MAEAVKDDKIKLCMNCTRVIKPPHEFMRCGRLPDKPFTNRERANGGDCGPEGRFYEPSTQAR